MVLIALLLVAATVTTAGQPAPFTREQQELVQLEREWDEAFSRRDVRRIERILADEFVATYADGTRGDRARELQLTAEFNQQVDESAMEDFLVQVHGDTAVVMLTKRMAGPRQGQRVTVAFRYIDVFVRRDGRWQCVASQSTRLSAP